MLLIFLTISLLGLDGSVMVWVMWRELPRAGGVVLEGGVGLSGMVVDGAA